MRLCLSGDDWRVVGLVPSEWAWTPLTAPEADLDHLPTVIPPWIRARVPGDVQSDLLDTGELPDPTVDLNSRYWEWTSQRDWVYVKEFDLPAWDGQPAAALRFDGVDYACHVFLNGTKLGTHEGTYTAFELDASAAIRPGATNRLIVVVEHAPVEPDQQAQIGWTNKVRLWKPRFAYKWDWCTRLIPLGIHDDVWLDMWDRARLSSLRCQTNTDARRGETDGVASIVASLDRLSAERLSVIASAYDDRGTCVARESLVIAAKHASSGGRGVHSSETAARLTLRIPNVGLWHPNGYGPQPLYTISVEIRGDDGSVLDSRSQRTGFRQVRAVPNYGAPSDALPYTLEVNGRKVFVKGWNWAPVDQLYGRIKEDRYRHAIRLAKDANCNLLRVWGGGLLERELFYNLCDEAGIMVWQEFHQSSSGINNEPARDPEYVAYCADQARNIVPRRAHHPSLVIWCGGNELCDDAMTPCDASHPVLAALRQVVEETDPQRIYLPTSPSGPVFAADPKYVDQMHDVHGHWLYLGDPGHYAHYNAIDPLFHSEFGCEGAANLAALKRFLSERYLWPPDRTNPAWVHHGSWWLHRDKIEAMFGAVEDLRTFVFASQWIQHEGLRYITEANRRRKWHTSGCAPWQYNESWPNASCTNCLDYYGGVRPAYWAMRGAYAPVLVSLRYDSLRFDPASEFRADVWLNRSLATAGPSEVRWTVWDIERCASLGDGRLAVPDTEQHQDAPVPVPLGSISVRLPGEPCLVGVCVWPADSDSGYANRYVFSSYPAPIFAAARNIPPVVPIVDAMGHGTIRLTCPRGTAAMVAVRADGISGYRGPYLSWGYAPFLMPGESVHIQADGSGEIEVSALNADSVRASV